jgi:hypothetical protein
MAIVIRFNTIVVRKARVAVRHPGGLDDYRSVYLPHDAHTYYEDEHLIAHTSMGALRAVEDRLAAYVLVAGYDDSGDYCGADQQEGPDAGCRWLESRHVAGLPVCWLAGEAPGYVVDFKSRRFVARVSEAPCAACGRPRGAGAAAMAVHERERRDGPLAFVDAGRTGADERYVVGCPRCGHEHVLDAAGRGGVRVDP